MGGHHPFQRLVENLPVERKLAIEQKKKAMLAEIELREAIESSIANWHLDPSTTSIEQVSIRLLRSASAIRATFLSSPSRWTIIISLLSATRSSRAPKLLRASV
jgi:hypothetical protein